MKTYLVDVQWVRRSDFVTVEVQAKSAKAALAAAELAAGDCAFEFDGVLDYFNFDDIREK